MGVFSPAGAPAPASVTSTGSKDTWDVQNDTIAIAGTEVSITLPSGLKAFKLQARNGATLQISGTSGASGTTYFTLPCGTVWIEEDLAALSGYTIYVQSNKAGTVVETIYWT